MSSARGLTLNDLSWHEVNLTRREANITLQIDVIHTTKSLLPGRFFELNIHYGVFIGGQGDFNELFLGKTHRQAWLTRINRRATWLHSRSLTRLVGNTKMPSTYYILVDSNETCRINGENLIFLPINPRHDERIVLFLFCIIRATN